MSVFILSQGAYGHSLAEFALFFALSNNCIPQFSPRLLAEQARTYLCKKWKRFFANQRLARYRVFYIINLT